MKGKLILLTENSEGQLTLDGQVMDDQIKRVHNGLKLIEEFNSPVDGLVGEEWAIWRYAPFGSKYYQKSPNYTLMENGHGLYNRYHAVQYYMDKNK